MRNSRLLVTISMVGLLVISCGGSESSPATTTATTPANTPPTSTINAGELYSTNCAVCHGANRAGTAGLGPALTPASLTDMSATQLNDIISNGRSGTAMTGFKGRINADEIEALAQFVKNTSP